MAMLNNPSATPAKMTRDVWAKMSPLEKARAVDTSNLNRQLLPYEGKKVRVWPRRAHGLSTFTVGRTTGWMPVHMAVRGRASGSSDIIGFNEQFDHIEIVR